MVEIIRDKLDYEAYGGNIPVRCSSVTPSRLDCYNKVVSPKENSAKQFDMSSTKSRWVNRDLSQFPEYKRLSDRFKNILESPKVNH